MTDGSNGPVRDITGSKVTLWYLKTMKFDPPAAKTKLIHEEEEEQSSSGGISEGRQRDRCQFVDRYRFRF